MSEQQAYLKPLPEINEFTKPYWSAAKEHQFIIQHCPACKRHHMPPAQFCPKCSTALEWVPASGMGRVHTYTIFHQLYHPAFQKDLPYNVTIVELAEGPMVLTNLVGVANSDIKVGMSVQVCFDDITPEETLVKFKQA